MVATSGDDVTDYEQPFDATCDRDGCGHTARWTVTPTTTIVECDACDWRVRNQVRRWVDSDGRAVL